MSDHDPFWKRSGFGQVAYAVIALGTYWLIDGQVPTSRDVLDVVASLMILMGYQTMRPTVPAPRQGDPPTTTGL